jgi:hypothetical protein
LEEGAGYAQNGPCPLHSPGADKLQPHMKQLWANQSKTIRELSHKIQRSEVLAGDAKKACSTSRLAEGSEELKKLLHKRNVLQAEAVADGKLRDVLIACKCLEKVYKRQVGLRNNYYKRREELSLSEMRLSVLEKYSDVEGAFDIMTCEAEIGVEGVVLAC